MRWGLIGASTIAAEHVIAALRAAGASYVVLAGKPGERTVRQGSGDDTVDDWAAMGVDALGFLGRIREELAR